MAERVDAGLGLLPGSLQKQLRKFDAHVKAESQKETKKTLAVRYFGWCS